MNGYARLSHVKADIAGVTGSSADDAAYLRAIDEESVLITAHLRGRHFHSVVSTRYFSPVATTRLWLHADLLAISAIDLDTNSDATYATALTAADYFLWPYDAAERNQPYRALEINPNSSVATEWPRTARGIRIAGIWGYSQETEIAGETTATINEALDTSETGIDMAAGHDIEKGEVVLIDTEQMWVTDSTPQSITVQRAVNGTTAATHLTGTTVYRRRYPRDVEQACKIAVVSGRWRNQSGYGGSVPDDAGGSRKPQWKYDWEQRLAGFQIPTVG